MPDKTEPEPEITLPPTFEQHVNANADKFEKQRQEVRDFCAERCKAEIEKTLGGIDDADPDIAEMKAQETRKIEAGWAEREAKRIDQINREQQLALDRTRELYGR